MNWDLIQGNWKKFEGQVKEKWGKLTNDDMTLISGKRERLLGRLQHAYGYGRDKAQKEIDNFLQVISRNDKDLKSKQTTHRVPDPLPRKSTPPEV